METRGRKTIDEEALTENITLRFTKKELQEIENIAKDLKITKTRFMRNLLLASLSDAKIFHKLGILKGAEKLIDFKERFSNPERYKTLQEA